MIRFLGIRDLAIVDTLECEFEPGFNVLTGETGAGKSIIVGAIGLLVGERGSSGAVRTGADRAVVQAAFETTAGGETIVRREVAAAGRGRIFIDDTLALATTLRKLGVCAAKNRLLVEYLLVRPIVKPCSRDTRRIADCVIRCLVPSHDPLPWHPRPCHRGHT